jgi:pimeloyl-ACP methyl ester carboxylesterase
MPILKKPNLDIEYTEEGQGDPVILIHGSGCTGRMWKRLSESLRERFHVICLNNYGAGQTSPWPGTRPQMLADQARLVEMLCETIDRPITLVGHSFGGAIAMKAAQVLAGRVSRAVILEPTLFYMLREEGRTEAFTEIKALADLCVERGNVGDWDAVAQGHADYWNGSGAWASLPPERKAGFAAAIRPNHHEWYPALNEPTSLLGWGVLPSETMILRGRKTVRPMAEIAELLYGAFPQWQRGTWEAGGHMAPLSHPDAVNPLIVDFLSS